VPLDESLKFLTGSRDGILSFYRKQEIVILRKAVDVDQFITRKEIDAILDRGLLRWPYFTVLKNGQRAPIADITEARHVGGRELTGLACGAGIQTHLSRGATLKLSQLEDWHRGTRDQQRSIESIIPVEAKAFVFLTPEDNTGMLPHRDGSHVLVVQLDGRKEWRLYNPGPIARSGPGLDVDTDTAPQVEVLEPGDVLYLPHGYPHAATAVGGWSMHLTFTLEEPAPDALADAVGRLWRESDDAAELRRDHQHLAPAEKARAVTMSLREELGRRTDDDIVTAALTGMRARQLVSGGVN